MIVSFGPHFFTSMAGAGGGGPINVSAVCEKALPVAKKIATIISEMNLQCIFIKLKYKKYDNVSKRNAV